jgi:dienelactone hydrolase
MDQDRYFAGEGDLDAAREIVEIVGPSAELYVHPGDGHPFEDSSLDSYDPDAAQLLTARVIHFLRRVDRS